MNTPAQLFASLIVFLFSPLWVLALIVGAACGTIWTAATYGFHLTTSTKYLK